MILCNWLILWQDALYLYLNRLRMCLTTLRNHISRSSMEAFKPVQEIKQGVQNHWNSTSSRYLLDTSYLSRFKNFRFQFWFSWDPWIYLWALFSPNPRHIKGLTVHKLYKHWANSVQANCDQRQSSWPSSSLFLGEVAVYLYHRVLWPSIFLIFIVWTNWRTL